MDDDRAFMSKVHKTLSPDLVVPNYIKLCGLLGMDVKQGDSKNAQIRNLTRFCEFQRNGHKYIINKIYSKPKPKLDTLVYGRNSIYVKYVENILLDYFVKKGCSQQGFPKSRLFEILGFVNDNYARYRDDKELALDVLSRVNKKITMHQLNRFYINSDRSLTNTLHKSLNSLQRRGMLEWSKEWCGVMADLNDGKEYIVSIMDVEGKKKMESISYEALDRLGCDSFSNVLYNKYPNVNPAAYYALMNEIAGQWLGYQRVFKQYYISCNDDFFHLKLAKNIIGIKKELNRLIVMSLNKQAETETQRCMAAIERGETDHMYLDSEAQKTLINCVIARNRFGYAM